MRDIRIAAAITNSPLGDINSNIDEMISYIEIAKHNNAEIICFPEMNITGYCSDSRIKNFAITNNDKIIKKLIKISKSNKITILTGMAEKDSYGNLFVSHLVISPDKSVGVYRKLYIAPPESKTYTKGNTIPVFEVKGFKFGIQLCYDAHFPELSTVMAAQGVHAIFIPHASPRLSPLEKFNSWMRHLAARAYDNSVFIIACNQKGDNNNGLCFPGLSLVIDPSGRIIEKDTSGHEGLLYADLKKESLDNVRNNKMKYFFPNRRKNLYK